MIIPKTGTPQSQREQTLRLHIGTAQAADRVHRGALVAKRGDWGPDHVSHRKISRRAII